MQEAPLGRRAGAELVGTAFLTLSIVGSGIAATRLSPGDHGFQLLLNALATGFVLVAIILAIGPVSGGQINPAITLVAWISGGLGPGEALTYVAAQLVGAALGAVLANVIFGLPAIELAQQGPGDRRIVGFRGHRNPGLVLVVFGLVRSQLSAAIPYAVGAYIMAAILFTSSTSFANPAATIARSLSNTFAGIAPASVPMFVLAEIAGGLLGLMVVAALFPPKQSGST